MSKNQDVHGQVLDFPLVVSFQQAKNLLLLKNVPMLCFTDLHNGSEITEFGAKRDSSK